MSKPEVTTRIRIQANPQYWITVEDLFIDVGCNGLTISYWENCDGQEKRIDHLCISEDSALPLADAIYKLFKKEEP